MPEPLSLENLLAQLEALQVRLSLDEQGDIRVRAAKGTLQPTLVELIRTHKAALVEWLQRQADAAPIPPRPPGQPVPPSSQQHQLWLVCEADPASTSYHIPSAVIISGHLDPHRLETALHQLVARHALLARVFCESRGRLELRPGPHPIGLEQATTTLPANAHPELLDLARAWFREGFDLARGPLLRLRLVQLPAEPDQPPHHLLLLNIHHLITDGWTNRLLFTELLQHYNGETLPPPDATTIDYLDYAVWQQRQLQSGYLQRGTIWWQQQLQECEPLALCRQPAWPDSLQQAAAARIELTLDDAETALLRDHARSAGVTLFSLLLATYQITLYQLTHCPLFAIACPLANRQRPELQQVAGFFVNTLPIKADFTGNPLLGDFVRHCHHTLHEAISHSEVPFAAITDALYANRQEAVARFFEAAINHETDTLFETTTQGGLTATPLEIPPTHAKFPLALTISDRSRLQLHFDYHAGLFDQDFIQRLADYYLTVLKRLPGHSLLPVTSLGLLDATAQRILTGTASATESCADATINRIGASNRTTTVWPDPELSLFSRIARQAEKSPLAIAVSSEDGAIDYRTLIQCSERLARRIARQAGSGGIIAVSMARSLELSVALLAILRSGNAYLPLDSALPPERISFLLADSASALVLVDRLFTLPDSAQLPTLTVDITALAQDEEAMAALPWPDAPDPLFNLIYTSGSTGTPKGVRVGQRAITNRLLWMQASYPIGAGDTVLQKTPISFDVSVWELFWPLLAGARLHHARPDGHRDSRYLRDTIRDESITVMHFVPSMLGLFLETDGIEACTSLRLVFCSGEALPTAMARHFLRRLPATRLYNLYGPTEAAVDVSHYDCGAVMTTTTCPIGQPIANTQLHILDEHLHPLLPGAIGELYIGGIGLAQGYHNNPGLTEERFIDNPWFLEGHPSPRLYKTGDLCRYLPDGNIEFIGRNDHQIKVRGLRIETGEIEAQLQCYPGIRQAVVLASAADDDDLANRQLILFYTADHAMETAPLRSFLAARLPAWMLPNAFVFVPEIPLTGSGKIDRRALLAAIPASTAPGRLPATMTEQEIQAIWQHHFGKPVGVDTGFFELGGHSLLASRIISEIGARYQVELRFRDIFSHDTVQALAARINSLERNQRLTIPVSDRSGTLPLTSQQQRLFLFQQLNPASPAYNMPAALLLAGELHIALLERSLQLLVSRHAILRTRYIRSGDSICQQIMPAGPGLLDYRDLSGAGLDADKIAELAASHASQPFDLQHDLPVRATLYKLAPGNYLFCFCLHHIAGDAVSLEHIVSEITASYRAFVDDRTPQLPELSIQYADYACWQQSSAQHQTRQQQLGFWQQQLAGAPELLDLPHDRPRPPLQDFTGAQASRELQPALVARLLELCRTQQLTPFMVLLSCYQLLLAKIARMDDICVGIPVAGRNQRQLQPLVGFFVNSLIIRSRQHNNPSGREFLQQQKALLLAALEHQELPVEEILASLPLQRTTAYTPVVQVGFNFLQDHASHRPPQWPGLTLTPLETAVTTAKYEMTWICYQHEHGIRVAVEFNSELFDSTTIAHWLDCYTTLLDNLLQHHDWPIQRLQCLDADAMLQQIRQLAPGCVQAYPLTPMQRDIYIDSLMAPNSRQNHIGFVTCSTASLDIIRWQQVLLQLYYHADSLRATIVQPGTRLLDFAWQAVPAPAAALPESCFSFTDHGSQPLDDSVRETVITAALHDPYDFSQPLWRVRIHRFAGCHLFILAVHHAMFDGVSIQSLGRLLKGNYEKLLLNQAVELPANNYSGFVQQALLTTDTAPILDYWQQQTGQLASWLDFTAPRQDEPPGLLAREHQLPADDWLTLQHFCRRHHITPAVYFKTLFALALKQAHHFTSDFAFAETVTGRDRQYLTTQGLCFQQQPNIVPAALTTGHADISELFRYFSRLRKTLAEVTPLSLRQQKLLLGEPIPYLFNFYIMESSTLFLGQQEQIEHLMPAMANAVNLIIKVIADTASLQLCFNRRQLDGDRLLESILQIHARLLQGETGLSRLCAPDSLPLVFSCDCTQLAVACDSGQPLAIHTAENSGLVIIDPFGNPLPAGQAGAIVANDSSRTPTGFIGLVQNNCLHLLARSGDRRLRQATAIADTPARLAPYPPARQLVAPRNNTERELVAIWQEVLGREGISITDNFFELGGHSLLAMRIANRLQERYRLQLPLEALFHHPTIATIAGFLHETLQHGPATSHSELPPLARARPQADWPLSHAQQRLWLLAQIGPANAAYNIPVALQLTGTLDQQALTRALHLLLQHQQVLASRMVATTSGPRMVIDPPEAITINQSHFRGEGAEQQAWLDEQLRSEAARPFDISRDHLLRIGLIHLGCNRQVLTLTLHHLIADAQSLQIIARELASLYSRCRIDPHSSPAPLASAPLQYHDYAVWQQQLLESPLIARQLAYWQGELSGVPLLSCFPCDFPRPESPSFQGRLHSFTIPDPLTAALRTTAATHGISLFMLLLAAFQLQLSLASKQQDCCIGIPHDGRFTAALENLVGFFVNALAIRVRLDANYTFAELLEQVREKTLLAFSNQHVPAEMVLQALALPRQARFMPVIQTAFNFIQGIPPEQSRITLDGLEIEPLPQPVTTAKFELLLSVQDDGKKLAASIEFNTALYRDESVAQIASQWCALLQAVTSDSSQRLYTLAAQPFMCTGLAVPAGSTLQPLTTIQRDLVLASLRKPGTRENNIGYALALPLRLDLRLWQASLQALHDHHAMLRAGLVTDANATPWFAIPASAAAPLEILDWSARNLSDAAVESELRALVLRPWQLDCRSTIDPPQPPERQPLLRNYLVKLADTRWHTVLACHHIMLDGMSFTLHAYQLVTNYFHLLHGRTPQFTTDNYPDYVPHHLASFDLPENIRFWRERLQPVRPLQVSVSARPDNSSLVKPGHDNTVQLLSQTVTAEDYQQLQQFCRAQRITPALYYLCLYAILVRLYCRASDDFVLFEYAAGRSREFTASLGCHYQRQLAIFAAADFADTFATLFATIRRRKQQEKPHQALALLTQAGLVPAGNLSFSYNFFHMPKSGSTEGVDFAGHSYSPDFEENIDLRVQLDLGQLTLALCFQPSLFAENRFLDRLQHISRQVLAGCSRIADLDLLLPDEPAALSTPAHSAPFVPLTRLVSAQAAGAPAATAVICGQQRLSYQRLEQLTHLFASQLQQAGVTRGDRVAICLHHRLELVPALLGTIRAGACYVLVDPAYPAERITYLLEDSAATVVLTETRLAALVQPHGSTRVINIDTIDLDASVSPVDDSSLAADDRLYMIYTSGSTGLPKGVQIYHHSAANLLAWYRHELDLSAADRTLVISSLGFDLTQKNLFAPLQAGGTVVLADTPHYDPQQIRALIATHAITHINCAPAAFYPLLETPGGQPLAELATLRLLCLGGETIQLARLRHWIGSDGFNCTILNMYGPTECTDIASSYRLPPQHCQALVQRDHNVIPIGYPLPGVTLYLLQIGADGSCQKVPPGLPGEICIAGSSVGPGYWQRPELQRHAFIPNPFATNTHDQVLYRTGDLGWLPAAATNTDNRAAPLYYLGRLDNQIKLHGLRIEPGEIEAQLRTLPGIRDAVVLADRDQLLAFVLGSQPSTSEWRALLATRLPAAMLPSHIIAVSEWPLTAHGKIDRPALLALERPLTAAAAEAPRNPIEQQLLQLWQEVLGSAAIGIHANFFESGGSSLQAVQLVSRIEQHFATRLPVAALFSAQTIARLAQLIESRTIGWSPLVPIQPQGSKPPLFAFHALGGMVFHYEPLARALGNDQPLYGIQAYGLEEGQTPFTDLDAMTEFYLHAILEQQRAGPYQLLGHSFGGLLAMEVARKLQQAGHVVSRVIMLDTYLPNRYFRAQADDATILKLFAEHNFGISDIPLRMLRSLSASERIAAVAARSGGLVTPAFLERAIAVIRGFQQMMGSYRPQPLNLPILLVRPATLLQLPGTLGWDQITQQLTCVTVAGDHHTMLGHLTAGILQLE